MPAYTNDGALQPSLLGVAQAELVINRSDIPLGFGRIEIEASIHDPDDFDQTLVIDEEGTEAIGLAEYQNRTHTIALGDTIGDFKIIEMNQKYFLGENIKINKVDTLKMQGEE